MLVYRWEHPDSGVGPLSGEHYEHVYWWNIFKDHSTVYEFTEFDEYLTSINEDSLPASYFFAWCSIDHLIDNLFDHGESDLRELGFVLMTYDVTENFVIMPDGQVIFHKQSAKLIDTF